MTEKELMDKLCQFANELEATCDHRCIYVNIYKGDDWPAESSDDDIVIGFMGDVDDCDLEESNQKFVATLFDLSLYYSVKDIWHDDTDLNILVSECHGESNITAETIEKLTQLVWNQKDWDEFTGR